MKSSDEVLTDNSDHPHEYVCETWDPYSWHEEGYREPLLPEPSPAVRDGQEQQRDDGQGQNPEDSFQVIFWHRKHAFMFWEENVDQHYDLVCVTWRVCESVNKLLWKYKKMVLLPTWVFFFFFYLQESHWGHVGWGKDEKNQIHRGRSRCLFWSDCALAGWCRRSSPSEVVSLSSLGILYPGTCSKGSAFSTQTHWCEGQSTEPQCRPHRPAEDRRRRTWEPVETLRFHIKIFSISISLAFHQNPFRDRNIV